MDMPLELGAMLRYTADPSDLWTVTRVMDKSVKMARCDERGRISESSWTFRKTTVLRDFHPA